MPSEHQYSREVVSYPPSLQNTDDFDFLIDRVLKLQFWPEIPIMDVSEITHLCLVITPFKTNKDHWQYGMQLVSYVLFIARQD